MSKSVCAALAGCLVLSVSQTANAASQSSAVTHAVRSFNAKANAGDGAGALALFTDSASIVDEFAPFGWSKASDWGGSFAAAYGPPNGISGAKTKILKFAHVNVDGNNAYVVDTAVFSYKENRKLRKEPGMEVYSLVKGDGGWRINSFAWFGKTGVEQGADAQAVVAAAQDFASMKAAVGGPPTAITDEFAPYNWTGTNAATDWGAGLQKSMASTHDTDLAIGLQAPSQLSIAGDRTYAAVPTVLTFKHNGKPTKELGAFAFAFEKTNGTWRIASWTWATK